MIPIDLSGKKVFIAGIGDDQGFGWSIAKTLAAAGATILIGTWPPVYNIFLTSWERGKFDASRKMDNGTLWDFAKVYPLDATFDTPADVSEEIKNNKRYKDLPHFTISEIAKEVGKDFGKIDYLVHALANAPEVKKDLLKTSRQGYLAALSASSYSFLSLVSHFGPLMNDKGAALTLSYLAAERAIPGYGGGMSSAKAALESDTKTLSWEAGRKWGIRINAISAGPLRSRAARAIGMIDPMIAYYKANAPLRQDLLATDIAHAALFLLSPLASAITGEVVFVDNGLHVMGLASDSKSLNP